MQEEKIHYLYQITNHINGKIYVGVHQTNDVDDGYMGSGTLLQRAYEKYGIENFEKRILEYFSSVEEMYQREGEIVDLSFIQREDTYNLCEGGKGWRTFDSLQANERRKWLLENDPEFRAAYAKKLSESIPGGSKEHMEWLNSENKRLQRGCFHNEKLRQQANEKSRSPEAIAKKKETFARIGHQQGEKNSSFGKHWIHKGTENRLVPKNDPVPEGWEIGRKIK